MINKEAITDKYEKIFRRKLSMRNEKKHFEIKSIIVEVFWICESGKPHPNVWTDTKQNRFEKTVTFSLGVH